MWEGYDFDKPRPPYWYKPESGLRWCKHCDAVYSPATDDVKWYRGYDTSRGTESSRFNPAYQVDDDCCPNCLRKHEV